MNSDVQPIALRAPSLLWLAGASMFGFDMVFILTLNYQALLPLATILLGLSFALCGRFAVLNSVRVSQFFNGQNPSRARVWAGGTPSGMAMAGWVFTWAGAVIAIFSLVFMLTGW